AVVTADGTQREAQHDGGRSVGHCGDTRHMVGGEIEHPCVLLLPEREHKKLKPLESRVRVLIDVEVYHHPLIVAPWGEEIHVELQLGRRVTDGERRDVWPGSHSVALRIGHRAAAGGR